MKARLPYRSGFTGRHQKEAKGSQQPSGGWHASLSLGTHPSQSHPWGTPKGALNGVEGSDSYPVCPHSPSHPVQEVLRGQGAGPAMPAHLLQHGRPTPQVGVRGMCLTPSLPFLFLKVPRCGSLPAAERGGDRTEGRRHCVCAQEAGGRLVQRDATEERQDGPLPRELCRELLSTEHGSPGWRSCQGKLHSTRRDSKGKLD